MKMKKYLLPGMMAALAFAACTNEEIVSQQTEAPEVDLSSRPVVGMVDLNFGPQTRATLAEDRSFNSLDWENDAVGARLIDELVGARNNWNPFVSYQGGQYAYTNYKYNKVEGDNIWTTEALLVEGNYMFYAPYNEDARKRDPLTVTFPMKQVVNTEDAGVEGVDANTSAIKGFYENKDGHVFALGHAFISANEEETTVKPTMTHLYAYPEITLKNDYKIKVEKEMVGQAITVDKIVLSSSKIYGQYQLNHKAFIDNLHKDYAQIKEGGVERAPKIEAGAWYKGLNEGIKTFRNAKTTDFMTGSKAGNIEIDFEPNLTIAAGEEFPFHVVLPAAAYTDLAIQVVLEGDKTFYSALDANDEVDYTTMKSFSPAAYADAITDKTLTYAPQHRYPVQEWNFPTNGNASVKASAGALATFTLGGYVGDYKAPRLGIKTIEEFEEYLASLKDNTSKVVEESAATFTLYSYSAEEGNASNTDNIYGGYAQLELTQELLDLVDEYLDGGAIGFTSKMAVSGKFEAENTQLKKVGGLKQLDDKVITLTGVEINGDAEFKGEATIDGTIKGNATFNGVAKSVKGSIGGNATFNGNATVEAAVTGKAFFNAGTATVKGSANGAEINAATVTVQNNGNLGEVVVYNNGTLNLNNNYAAQVIVGKKVGNNMTAGNLNINAKQTAAKIALESGIVTNNNEITLASWTWTAGTLKNNATIKTALDVPAGATYEHGANAVATINKVDSKTVNNAVVNGIVENYGELVVATNNGLIETMGNMTYTTVNAGDGAINNTNLGVVYATGHVVYYNTGSFSNDEAWKKIEASTQNGINKLVVTGEWNVTAATSVPATYTVVEFQSNLNVTDVTLKFASTTEVVLGTNSTWKGRTIESSIVDGMKCVKENGKVWTVKYLTLGSSYVSNAMDNGGVLKLTKDLNFGVAHDLTGLNLVIDLNDFNLTSSADKAIVLGDDSKLTIKNGTFKSAGSQLIRIEGKATLNVEDDAVLEAKSTTIFATKDAEDATLNIKGTVKATYANVCAVITNGNIQNITVNVDGATIESNGGAGSVALYVPSSGNVTINNSNLKGYDSAVEYRGEGKLTINGGTFESTATTFSATANGSGSTIVGAAVAVSPYADRDVEVVISGTPTLKAANADCCAFWEGTTVETKGRTTVNDFKLNSKSVGKILKGQDTAI